jgi:hypothetical protein
MGYLKKLSIPSFLFIKTIKSILMVLFYFVWEIKIKRWVARLEGPSGRPQRKGTHWGMGGARTAGGGSRDRTRHFPLLKNPHKMEEVHFN